MEIHESPFGKCSNLWFQNGHNDDNNENENDFGKKKQGKKILSPNSGALAALLLFFNQQNFLPKFTPNPDDDSLLFGWRDDENGDGCKEDCCSLNGVIIGEFGVE